MTKLLDMAIHASRDLPAEMQDELARIMLTFVGQEQQALELTADEKASFETSLGQASSGDFASPDRLKDIWARYGK